MFLEIIGGLASVASISGITAKELIPFISDPDKKLFEKYFSYLEGKKGFNCTIRFRGFPSSNQKFRINQR